MKIAISSTGKSINDNVSDVFARCPYFIIVEIEDQKIKNTEEIENENKEQMSGAGVSVAQLIAEKDVNAVIAKNIGPRALDVLKQFNIKPYSGQGVIKEVLQELIKDKLEEIR